MNQGKLEQALTLLTQADAMYVAEVPEDALKAKPAPAASHLGFVHTTATSSIAPDEGLLTDPRAQSALLGLIEVRRNRAVVLRVLGKPDGSRRLAAVGQRPGARQRIGAADRQRPAVPHHRAHLGGAAARTPRRWRNCSNPPWRSARRCPARSRWRRPTC